ncbi:unnamed protein product, partial [Discosporangium mesarthrocarpum]
PQQPIVFFLATCPDPSALGRGLLQRGRLESTVKLGALDEGQRALVLSIHARDMPLLFQVRGAGGATGGRDMVGQGGATQTQDLRDCFAVKKAEVAAAADRSGEFSSMGGGCTLPASREEFLWAVARRCHGYLGADLQRLCREAAMHHMATLRTTKASTGVAEEKGTRHVRLEDFWEALDVVRPASLTGHILGGTWGGREGAGPEAGVPSPTTLPLPHPPLPPPLLAGCDSAMAELRSSLLAPLAHPALLRGMGLRPSTGALLHGPHGCGKTSLARALAGEARGLANFLHVQCADLVDKVVGRSEHLISELFATARSTAPCILFLDQVEGVATRRGYHSSSEQTFDRILSTLLVEMDGVRALH